MRQLVETIRIRKRFWIYSGFILLCLAVFLMPFPRSWSLYPLGLSMVAGLLIWIADYENMRKVFLNNILLIIPPVAYFFLILVYFLIGRPGWEYLEGNFMFLLVPVFCFPVMNSDYFRNHMNIFLWSFIYGLISICLFEFLRASLAGVINLPNSADVSFDPESYVSPFRSQKLSFLEHPTYLSIKVLFAVCILILIKDEIKLSSVIKGIMVLVLVIFIYFLSSRTIYLASIFVFLFLLYRILKRYHLHILMLIVLPIILFGAYKLFSLNPRMINKTEIVKKRYTVDNLKFKDIDPRLTSWFTASDLIKEHPVFGVGLTSKDILADEYRKNGYNNEANLRLNAHNQFLETQLALGIPGSLLLLWMVFAPLLKPKYLWKPALYYSFLIILITSFLFESVLVRQWGIMFYTLFYTFQINIKPVMFYGTE